MEKYLELDIGNSFCKWRLLQNQKALDEGKIVTKELENITIDNEGVKPCLSADSKTWLLTQGSFTNIENHQLDGVYICSVASDHCNKVLKQIARELWKHEPNVFKTQHHTAGVKNSYQDPSKMGADRWLVSISAVHKYPNRCLYVVDCGSAINIEILSQNAEHLGGYIIPGIGMMQNTLLKNTAKVSKAIPELRLGPGKETGSNVANGSLFTAVAVIEKLQRKAEQEKGFVLLTGGDAVVLKNYLDMHNVKYIPDLVMDGFECWRRVLRNEEY